MAAQAKNLPVREFSHPETAAAIFCWPQSITYLSMIPPLSEESSRTSPIRDRGIY